MTEKQIKK